jgi:hypothetical protein
MSGTEKVVWCIGPIKIHKANMPMDFYNIRERGMNKIDS